MQSISIFGGFLFLGLIWPVHVNPSGSFYSELLVVFGVIVGFFSRFTKEAQFFRISGSSFLVISFFIFFCVFYPDLYSSSIGVQFFLFVVIYLLASIFAIVFGASFEDDELVRFVVPVIGFWILCASLVNFFVQLIQFFDFNYFSEFLILPLDRERGRPYGNLGQPNLLATLYGVAVCFLLWLYFLKRITDVKFFLIYSCLMAGIALTASRTALLFFFLYFYFLFFRDFLFSRKFRFFVIVFGFFIFLFFSIIFWRFFPGANDVVGVRVLNSDSSGRLDIWRVTLHVIGQNSWLGVGPGRYTEAFSYSNYQLGGLVSGFAHHSHNFFLQLAVEYGAFVFFIFLLSVVLILFLNFRVREKFSSVRVLGFSVISVIFIHAQFEFPLWYLYFLIPFSFFLGVFDKTKILDFSVSSFVFKSALFSFLIASLFFSAWISLDFRQTKKMMDAFLAGPVGYGDAAKILSESKFSMFASQREYVRFMILPVEDSGIQKRLPEVRLAVWRHAFPMGLVKLSVMEAILGNYDHSNKAFNSLVVMYPEYLDDAYHHYKDACFQLKNPIVCGFSNVLTVSR